MQDVNYTHYQFPLDVRGKRFKYYMWEIRSVQGGGFCQVSEFSIENADVSGIMDVTVEADTPAYNLAGQRVSKNTRGIVIVNGKKVIR